MVVYTEQYHVVVLEGQEGREHLMEHLLLFIQGIQGVLEVLRVRLLLLFKVVRLLFTIMVQYTVPVEAVEAVAAPHRWEAVAVADKPGEVLVLRRINSQDLYTLPQESVYHRLPRPVRVVVVVVAKEVL